MINIVYHSSDSFSSVLAVSMASIMANNKQADGITFYVIENNISEDNKHKLSEMVEGGGRNLIFIPMPDFQKEFNLKLLQVKKKWMFDSYSRMFLGSILPDTVERALYLDCDTLCDDNLEEFYQTDLTGYCCAGVTDCLSEKYYKIFEMNSKSYYVNSGMLLINLKAWREENIEQMVVDYVEKKHGYVFFMEQSVLNIVLQERIKIVHPRYNTFTLMISLSRKNLYRLRDCKRFYSANEVKEALAHPCIIHMTNFFYVKGRPWIMGNAHPFKDIFLKYKKMTPWSDTPLFADNLPMHRKMLISILNRLPQSWVCSLIGWVYNYWRPKHIEHDTKSKMRA
jgi:lipopolysaccharide biosynthesis glycosyltransferase